TVLVQRGQMFFPTARFRVEGEVTVAYAPTLGAASSAAPLRLDLTATSTVRGTSASTGQRERYNVTLVIRGPLTPEAMASSFGSGQPSAPPSAQRLTIEARWAPPLPQQDILKLIGRQSAVENIMRGGGTAQTALRGEIENVLTASVAPTLFVPVETAIED